MFTVLPHIIAKGDETQNILTQWLPKHELNKDKTNRLKHARVDAKKAIKELRNSEGNTN